RRIVALVEWRKPREEADAHFHRDRYGLRVADEARGGSSQCAKAIARRVGVDADRATDRVLDAAQIGQRVMPGREIVKSRETRKARAVHRLREFSERAR